jgi:hypothetical protein
MRRLCSNKAPVSVSVKSARIFERSRKTLDLAAVTTGCRRRGKGHHIGLESDCCIPCLEKAAAALPELQKIPAFLPPGFTSGGVQNKPAVPP